MSITVTILGCGSSGGVPRLGQGWGACDPANPKNQRNRCSILIERENEAGAKTVVLVDTSPDLRQQLLATGTNRLDGIVITHSHADHTHGIDDVRPLVIHMARRIDTYMDAATSAVVREAFSYIFTTPPGSMYPPLLDERRIEAGRPFAIDGPGGPITLLPVEVEHGEINALGLKLGNLLYMPDVNRIPDAVLPHLEDLDMWVLDALRYRTHPSHFSVDEALGWIARMGPRRAILTNLHTDLDYDTLARELPDGIQPAYDGLRIVVDAAA
jgi:phosphoribosyl 1,2-cyclic phosphate phosphodiesterase